MTKSQSATVTSVMPISFGALIQINLDERDKDGFSFAGRNVLKANYNAILLSQYVRKLSLHSVLLFFSNESDP